MEDARYELHGLREPRPPRRGVPVLLVLVLLIAGGIFMLSPYPEKIRRKLGLSEPPVKVVSPPPSPVVVAPPVLEPVVPEPEERIGDRTKRYVPQDGTDVLKMSTGLDFKGEFRSEPGEIASRERKKEDSYTARYLLKVRVPEPSTTLEHLAEVNPMLPTILPGLAEMLPDAKVSPFYHTLYQNKAERLRNSLFRLDDLLTSHNYYDCETMLEMTHPVTKRKVFFLQGDMDVVSDGSDGDRLAVMPDEVVNSTHYQPFTSYGWKKTGKTPNPMVAGWKKRIANAKKEMANPATDSARKDWLRVRLRELELGVADMERRSFLIADYDPFIVIPVNLLMDRKSAFVPNVGDYAVVVYENMIYPAIVGDGGPSFKVGEASLRMARQLDEKAGPYRRPVSSLGVSYVVFPRSAPEKKSAPDYEKWRKECGRLVGEIGGLGEGYELFQWEDKFPKPAPEIPAPPKEAESAAVE